VHLKNTPFERMSAGTLRLKLIKVGAVVILNTRRIRVLMSELSLQERPLGTG
jgi:hypothetical protein